MHALYQSLWSAAGEEDAYQPCTVIHVLRFLHSEAVYMPVQIMKEKQKQLTLVGQMLQAKMQAAGPD